MAAACGLHDAFLAGELFGFKARRAMTGPADNLSLAAADEHEHVNHPRCEATG